jgi:hypothetical protein
MHGHIQADGDGRDSDDGQPIADGFAGGSGLGYGRIPLRNGKIAKPGLRTGMPGGGDLDNHHRVKGLFSCV